MNRQHPTYRVYENCHGGSQRGPNFTPGGGYDSTYSPARAVEGESRAIHPGTRTVIITSKVVDCYGQTQAHLISSTRGAWSIQSTESLEAFTVKFDDPSFRKVITSERPWDHVEWSTGFRINVLLELLHLESRLTAVDDFKFELFRSTRRIARQFEMLPSSLHLWGLTKEGSHPKSGGAQADIWKGQTSSGDPICLKVLRFFTTETSRKKLFKEFSQEALVWSQLNHPNVLPFLGTNTDLFPSSYCLVSPWCDNGNVMIYLSMYPEANKMQIIWDIIKGLEYLHTQNPPVVHGDLKGANILVSNSGRCHLADFGLAGMMSTLQTLSSTGNGTRGSVRWMAPELFDYTTNSKPSTATDIYSLGCTIFEILTGAPPFSHVKPDIAVSVQIMNGSRPSRPAKGFSDELWEIVRRCYAASRYRPTIMVFAEELLIMETGGIEISSGFLCLQKSESRIISVSSATENLLNVFPTKIIIRILKELDAIGLLHCKLVCRLLRDLISEMASSAYTIELAVAGQEDGRYCTLTPVERLEILRKHQESWADLNWSSESRHPMKDDEWELFGNVLAQKNIDQSITFVQLPSTHRNIVEREWTVKLFEAPRHIRDFGIDPSQDLLILIEQPRRTYRLDHFFLIHTQTMSTATKHPLATGSGTIDYRQPSFDPPTSFYIQISSEYLGIFFSTSRAISETELVIWEWKTGRERLRLFGRGLLHFAFLPETHVLLARLSNGAVEFVVLDFELEDSTRKSHCDINHSINFSLPTLATFVDPFGCTIRSDPSPAWAPSSSSQVPFHVGSGKVFIISLWLQKRSFIDHLTLVVPESVFLSRVKLLGQATSLTVLWDSWGPANSRMISYTPKSDFRIWTCYVHGTKYVVPECSPRTQRKFTVQVFDFNQYTLKHAISQGDKVSQTDVSAMLFLEPNSRLCVTGPSIIAAGDLFTEEVRTFLPYRWIAKVISTSNDTAATLCSEDSIIVVDDDDLGDDTGYRVFSF